MRSIAIMMHVSIDGFTAGPNGEMNFISFDEEMQAYVRTLFRNVDTVVFGKNTFLMMQQYWPAVLKNPASFSPFDQQYATWVDKVTKLVVSTSLESSDWNNTTIIPDASDLLEFKQHPGNTMAIIGSPSLVHSCLQLDLIDKIWINVNPVVLGRGIPLFYNVGDSFRLKLESSMKFNNGVVALQYTRQRS
jgi:dihydrofolate reductase